MKILLVCAAGMSTGILMRKMEQYAQENQIDLAITAVGVSSYTEYLDDYDVVLIGPQVSYKLDEVKSNTNKPVTSIPPMDYAMGDCKNIFQLVNKISS